MDKFTIVITILACLLWLPLFKEKASAITTGALLFIIVFVLIIR